MSAPLYGFKAFWNGKECEVYAESSLKAQNLATVKFKAKKSYEVTVICCERPDGSTITHKPQDVAS